MLKVNDVYKKSTLAPSLVYNDDPLDMVKEKMVQGNPVNRSVYVVNQSLQLLGIITLQELMNVLAVRTGTKGKRLTKGKLFKFISHETMAQDIMMAPVCVHPSDSLITALELFLRYSLEELPVVDKKTKVIGDLHAYKLISEIG